jgi:hypothetical protein
VNDVPHSARAVNPPVADNHREIADILLASGLSEKQAGVLACAICDDDLSFGAKMLFTAMVSLAGPDLGPIAMTEDELAAEMQRANAELLGLLQADPTTGEVRDCQ